MLELPSLTPFGAKHLLELLCRQDILLVQTCKARRAGLPSFFGGKQPRPAKVRQPVMLQIALALSWCC